MRQTAALLLIIATLACQPAKEGQGATSSTAGPTTRTTGSPPAASVDSPRSAPNSTARRAPRTQGRSAQNSAEVTITLDRSSYSAGGTANVSVTSHSRDTLGYNFCSSRTVERKQGESWVAIPEPGRMCTMEIRLLNPGETQTASITMPESMPAGTYRVVITFSRQRPSASGSVRAISSSFSVAR
jgi:uncharacterized protein YfaS (alpha-2-macroglobulin family)